MLQIRNDINIQCELENNFAEAVFAKLEKSGYEFLILLAYNPPRYNKQTFLDELDIFLDKNATQSLPLVVGGDINIDTNDNNLLANNYKNIIDSHGFHLLSDKPTRVDHFIVKSFPDAELSVLEQQNFADHYPVMLEWQCSTVTHNSKTTYRDTSFLKSSAAVQDFNAALGSALNGSLLLKNATDMNELFNEFNQVFLNVTKTSQQLSKKQIGNPSTMNGLITP